MRNEQSGGFASRIAAGRRRLSGQEQVTSNRVLFLLALLLLNSQIVSAWGGDERPRNALTQAEIANQANAPLSSIMQVRFRDTYIPKYEHMAGQSNLFGIDITMPLPAHRLLPIRHLSLLSIPACATVPNGNTGAGDLRFVDLGIAVERKHFLLGVGPVFVMPTASDREFGQGKWQIGPAGGVATFSDRWLAGVLVQNPMSVGGDQTYRRVNSMLLQPFVSYQIGKGWFVRSQPQLYFDWETKGRIYPIDLGVGKTFKIGPQLISCYIQPFWNICADGMKAPRNGVTVGVTFLYPNFWNRVSGLWRKNDANPA
jgi:hypothetical protein